MNKLEQYSTHQQLLIKAALNTQGIMIELGSGWYSTPILHEIAKYQKRLLYTYDNNAEWLANFTHLHCDYHQIILATDLELVLPVVCGMVFVDSAPGPEREWLTNKFREVADVLVLHDTEEQVQYGWQRLLPTFKYQYTDKTQPTWTTICSDRIDVRNF